MQSTEQLTEIVKRHEVQRRIQGSYFHVFRNHSETCSLTATQLNYLAS